MNKRMVNLCTLASRALTRRFWILWPLVGTIVPRGRFLDLTIVMSAAVVAILLVRWVGPMVRISISPDMGSLAAVAGGQVATVGVALYVAGMAASRFLLWSTAQKLFVLLVAGSVATSAWGPRIDFDWIFGHVSDLQTGAEAADLPYLP
jgi:hypothetical protein